ncbi:MAG TPA: glutamate formimidoyltransferase [Chloroflexota bacterium]|nr:glutamate formimidoyltransferase [Chloroflexota bacterium]HZU08003.1 glutamate formimidoyltransferase [Chloroflexota bacterium]
MLVECVPNFSEGRDAATIAALEDAVRGVDGVRLLDTHSDPDHHRTVLTLVGTPAAVAEAAFRAVREAAARIDLRRHRGVHPRIGAADVVPFVPLGSTPMATCVALAEQVGARVGAELGLPVYLYGEAARRPERRSLAAVRRGEYEGLAATIGTDPARAPDYGPAVLGPAGAVAIGARLPLVAFNVFLATDDLTVAQAVAREVRASSGGLPAVQALGVPTSRPGVVQVAMNLTDTRQTSVLTAFTAVREAAARRGVAVLGSELVGLALAEALLPAAAAALGLPALAPRQLLELAWAWPEGAWPQQVAAAVPDEESEGVE